MQSTPPQSQISGLYYQRPLPQVRFFYQFSLRFCLINTSNSHHH
jgi:hypothetical protein